MDLLEYMRSQNNMTQAEWERRFEDAARELLVLLAGSGGARECNGFGDSAHSNLAYVESLSIFLCMVCREIARHRGPGGAHKAQDAGFTVHVGRV